MKETSKMFKMFRRVRVVPSDGGQKKLEEDDEIAIKYEDIIYCEAERLYFDRYEQRLAENGQIFNTSPEECSRKGLHYMECTFICANVDGEKERFHVPMTIIRVVKYLNGNNEFYIKILHLSFC